MSRREILSSFLLAFYLFALMRPILPCLEYQFKRAYIVEELCIQLVPNCAGNCYLSKQLKKAHNTDLHKELPLALGDWFILPSTASPSLSIPISTTQLRLLGYDQFGPVSDYCRDILKPPIG